MYEKKPTFPKVLVISHNVFSETSNMGRTLKNFFIDWNKDCIAQLYFHTEIPTTNVCENYFRITDFDVLKKTKNQIGTIFKTKDIRKDLKTERVDTGIESQIYQGGRKRKPYMYIGRNLIWSTNKWKNKKLFEWINEFNPDIIFFASGDYIFSYKIAMSIAKYKNIPILTYVCDDYYFLQRKSFSPLYYLNKFCFKHTIQKLFKKHKNIIAICHKIANDYSKNFDIRAETLMTVSSLMPLNTKNETDKLSISYIGNLGYNRHLMLAEIGNSLKESFNKTYYIDVYSTEKREHILKCLTQENGIKFRGSISYDEVKEIMANSDILIHTESFDEINREKVKYSVSTKIADSLSMGKCLLAYGPSDVASIEYLRANDCACVVTKEADLAFALLKLINDKNLREKYEVNALNTAKKYHNTEINCKKFREIIFNMVNKYESNAN